MERGLMEVYNSPFVALAEHGRGRRSARRPYPDPVGRARLPQILKRSMVAHVDLGTGDRGTPETVCPEGRLGSCAEGGALSRFYPSLACYSKKNPDRRQRDQDPSPGAGEARRGL